MRELWYEDRPAQVTEVISYTILDTEPNRTNLSKGGLEDRSSSVCLGTQEIVNEKHALSFIWLTVIDQQLGIRFCRKQCAFPNISTIFRNRFSLNADRWSLISASLLLGPYHALPP